MSGSGFTVKVKMNSTNKILKDHGLDENGKAIAFLRDDCKRLMAPFVPGGAGGTLSKQTTNPNNHSIKYTSSYAQYQYYRKMYISPKLGVSGIPLKNDRWWSPKGEKKIPTNKNLKYHTSGTGDHWDKRMLQKRKDDLVKDLENYIKSGG